MFILCVFYFKSADFAFKYRGADKSLVRPGRKQAQKHDRDARDFNNMETRAVIRFFFFPARQGAEGNWRHSDSNKLVSFLVGLRTYQHSCTSLIGTNLSVDLRWFVVVVSVKRVTCWFWNNRSLAIVAGKIGPTKGSTCCPQSCCRLISILRTPETATGHNSSNPGYQQVIAKSELISQSAVLKRS